MADQYHLWRKYPAAPYRRWACTLEAAPTADGFRVVSYDDKVADVHWLHRMQDTLSAHHIARSVEIDGDVRGEKVDYIGPGHPAHFEVAVRMVPDSVLRGIGRPT